MVRIGIALLLSACVLCAGCMGDGGGVGSPGPSTAANSTDTTPEGYTDRLNDTIAEYERTNGTDGIQVLVALENETSDAAFNRSVREMERLATVRHTFQRQRLVAITATPAELRRIANISTVRAVGVDREVTPQVTDGEYQTVTDDRANESR